MVRWVRPHVHTFVHFPTAVPHRSCCWIAAAALARWIRTHLNTRTLGFPCLHSACAVPHPLPHPFQALLTLAPRGRIADVGSSHMLEEFFVAPRAAPTDSVVYYPLEADEPHAPHGSAAGAAQSAQQRAAQPQPRYGLQLHIANLMQAPPGAPPLPPLQHVRTADAVPQVETLTLCPTTRSLRMPPLQHAWIPGQGGGELRSMPSLRTLHLPAESAERFDDQRLGLKTTLFTGHGIGLTTPSAGIGR
jgi:hypothetical protein